MICYIPNNSHIESIHSICTNGVNRYSSARNCETARNPETSIGSETCPPKQKKMPKETDASAPPIPLDIIQTRLGERISARDARSVI
jgi:hypothetical protein